LITAIILSDRILDSDFIPPMAGGNFEELLILERATAKEELPEIGVHSGEQFLRIWANPNPRA
jgi:hypothetical protein